MKTDIEYLRMLDADLAEAASRERTREAVVAETAARRAEIAARAPATAPRRRVWTSKLVAAGVPLLVVAGLVGWVASSGFPGGSDDAGSSGGAVRSEREAVGAPAETVPGLGYESVRDAAGDTAATWSQASPAAGAATVTDEQANGSRSSTATGGDLSKIVRTGSIAVVLENGTFDRGFARVIRIAGTNGGFVLSSTTRDQETRGTVVVRVPSKRFDTTMASLRQVGSVASMTVQGEDVTAEYIDLQARLDILQDRRTLLRELQSQATTSAEILRLAGLIEDVQLEIERIQGRLNYLQDQVAISTIRVELREQDAPSGTDPGPTVETPSLVEAIERGWAGFVQMVSFVIVGLGYLLPVAIIGGIVAALVMWVRRRHGGAEPQPGADARS
jgi:hypothetical protein